MNISVLPDSRSHRAIGLLSPKPPARYSGPTASVPQSSHSLGSSPMALFRIYFLLKAYTLV